jgi:hypothetical protein
MLSDKHQCQRSRNVAQSFRSVVMTAWLHAWHYIGERGRQLKVQVDEQSKSGLNSASCGPWRPGTAGLSIACSPRRLRIAIIIKNGAGMAVLQYLPAWVLQTRLQTWPLRWQSGRSQGLHQTCPAVFDAHRCLLMTGSYARAESTCSSPAKSRHGTPCMYASKHGGETDTRRSHRHRQAPYTVSCMQPCSVSIVISVFLDPLTPFIVPLQSMFYKCGCWIRQWNRSSYTVWDGTK